MLVPGTPEHASLEGRHVLYRWPVVGWCVGVVVVANKDARRTINRERVNALVHYEIDGETGAHVLKLEEYGTTEDAKWILLQAEAERLSPMLWRERVRRVMLRMMRMSLRSVLVTRESWLTCWRVRVRVMLNSL